jgi:predicted AlkP superfamily pyrophosphatase or phosphodiesterase
MRIKFLLFFLLIGISAHAQETPYVILVSFDGFRHDYVERYNLPNFKRFVNNGVSAEALIPSFPSKTFPNHYTLVTGLYPGNHGLVDNDFYDPKEKKLYAIKKRDMVEDPVFYGGTPLWQLAQQQGMKSASFYWVGSEAKIQGAYPNYYKLYDPKISNEERVDQTIRWLNLPEAERPHFISLYFSLVDHEAHETGPTSIQTQKVLHTADSLLGMLMDKAQATRLPINIVVVSDHGLYEMKREEKVFAYVSKLIDTKNTSVVFANAGAQVHFYTKNIDSLYTVLKNQEKNFRVYKQSEFPEHWHYKNERSGDILIVAQPGTYFLTTPRDLSKWEGKGNFGEHGYDPALTKEVNGIFYAIGPNVKQGVKIKAFENIHVYPFVAKILGLKTPEIDGDEKVLKGIYKSN